MKTSEFWIYKVNLWSQGERQQERKSEGERTERREKNLRKKRKRERRERKERKDRKKGKREKRGKRDVPKIYPRSYWQKCLKYEKVATGPIVAHYLYKSSCRS